LTKDLLKTLRDILKKNLTSEAGSVIMDQMLRAESEEGDALITVAVYKKVDEESWLPFAKPLHQFEFTADESELAFEMMDTYSGEDYDVSVTFGSVSEDALSSMQMAPYFEFMSSQAPIDSVLSGTKSEYIGEA